MKTKSNLQKKIIISIIFSIFFITTNRSLAFGPVIDVTNLAQNTAQVINQIKEGIKTVQEVKNTYDTVKNTAQNLKNFDLTQAASTASGAAMLQVGDIVTENIGTQKDSSTNVFTNGQQVIGDLNRYINKSSTNSIKKTLNDFEGAGSNPYQSKALSDTIKKLRGDAQSGVDKLKVVSLAAIAQKEICNDKKLKDIIKNGEPSTWVNPKPALKNVNIDELCNANLTAKETPTDNSDKYKIASWKIPLKKTNSTANNGGGNSSQNNTNTTNNSSALSADDIFREHYISGIDSNPKKLSVDIRSDLTNDYSFVPQLALESYTITGNNGFETSAQYRDLDTNNQFSYYSSDKKKFTMDAINLLGIYFKDELKDAGSKFKIKMKITLYASKENNKNQVSKDFNFDLDYSK